MLLCFNLVSSFEFFSVVNLCLEMLLSSHTVSESPVEKDLNEGPHET